MPPLVSICLPNLNNRPFLEERVQTILDQTWRDWELIIVDYQSDDGAWEYFQTLRDPRIRIQQSPRMGLYANWNHCIRMATGDFVYIATSDDTMTPDCLEKMVEALKSHPDCDLAHSNLRVIDGDGEEIPGFYQERCRSAQYFGALLGHPHVRLAPHDGLLHYHGGTVYVSIIQLLFRRSLFDRIGYFRNDLGSSADFEWGMRASLCSNTVHVPEYLASWRIHSNQATSFSALDTPESRLRHLKMTRLAWDHFAENCKNSGTPLPGSQHQWETVFRMDALSLQMANRKNLWDKLQLLGSALVKHPLTALHYVSLHLRGKRFDSLVWIRQRMRRFGLDKRVREISD